MGHPKLRVQKRPAKLQLHFWSIIALQRDISLQGNFLYMQELIEYIESGGKDKAELLRLYAPISPKTGTTISMLTNTKARDTHILYQVWKILPSELKAKYNQKLEIPEEKEATTPEEITPPQIETKPPHEEIKEPQKKKLKQPKAEMKSED
jgi:hypothetical protein